MQSIKVYFRDWIVGITKSRKLQDAGDHAAEVALEANLNLDLDLGNLREEDDAVDLAARNAGVPSAEDVNVLLLEKERDPDDPKPFLELKNECF